MRQERTVQASIFDLFAGHEIGQELRAISQWLDEYPALVGLVGKDLGRHGVKETGREGLPAELVLRCGLLKQHRQLSYEELAFHLEDLASFRAFARLPMSWTPKKSVLHKTISAIRAETWKAINRAVLVSAREEKVELGRMVRVDSTVTAALMHDPSDSSLLWDAVRVMVRLLREGRYLGWRIRRDRMARSPSCGQEASPRDQVHPRSTEPASALPGADQDRARRPWPISTRQRRCCGRCPIRWR